MASSMINKIYIWSWNAVWKVICSKWSNKESYL